MMAFWVVLLMVISTLSPADGKEVPLPMMPPRVMELVPTKMDCEGVSPLKVTGMGCTAMVPMESIC